MDDRVKHIIDSGLLEEYFLGLTDAKQSREIDMLLQSQPELKTKYEALENLMFDMSSAIAVKPPSDLLPQIKSAIRSDKLSISENEIDEVSLIKRFLPVAASLVFLSLAWIAYSNYKAAADLSDELATVRKELKTQKIQNMEMSSQLSTLADEFAFINDINTHKFRIKGNAKAKDFAMTAYWNVSQKKSMVAISEFPNISPNQCLQMWADVNGEMISVGILDHNKSYASIDFLDNAESLNITIEPKGGSAHPNVSNLIANVMI